jgi:hypothetical protein
MVKSATWRRLEAGSQNVSDSWVGLDHTGRSQACARGAHRECAHLSGPHRGFGAPLCMCACHSECPLGGDPAAPVKSWRQLCSCPGAGQERTRQDEAGERFADFDKKRWEERRRVARARKKASDEAFQAIRAAAVPGKSPEEIRELLNAGLRSRGLPTLSAHPAEMSEENRELLAAELRSWGVPAVARAYPSEVSEGKLTFVRRLLRRSALRSIVRRYNATIREARSETVKNPERNPLHLPPDEMASLLADDLARLVGGNAAAAELLGLTVDQVAAHREHAREVRRGIRRLGG